MARPKIESSRRKTHCISFWLTAEEFAELSRTAARARIRFNELARRLTVAGGDRVVIQTAKACDPALVMHLAHLGNNLNQLTRKAHVSGVINPQVNQLCERIDEIISEATAEAFDQ